MYAVVWYEKKSYQRKPPYSDVARNVDSLRGFSKFSSSIFNVTKKKKKKK